MWLIHAIHILSEAIPAINNDISVRRKFECCRKDIHFETLYSTQALNCQLRVQNFSVSIKGITLKHVCEYKYLGIIIDEVLSLKEHVQYVLSKAGKRIGMLRRIRKDLTVFVADKVYKAFIRPVMEYCDTVWGQLFKRRLA